MKLKALPFVLALLLTPALFAQDYEIRLVRPLKAGDQLKVTVTGKMSQSSTTTMNDNPPKENKIDISMQFSGTEKVVAVDSSGRETKAELTVDKFTSTNGDASTDVAPKGAVITCAIDGGKRSYQVDGKDAAPQTAMLLQMLVPLGGGPSEDDIYGTKDKKKKGDSWDINADLAKKSIEEVTSGGTMTEMKGKTTLDDVTADGLKISATLAGNVKPPLPPQIIVDSSDLTAKFSGVYPKDATAYPPTESEEIHFSFAAHAEGPNGKVVIKGGVEQSQTRTATVVK